MYNILIKNCDGSSQRVTLNDSMKQGFVHVHNTVFDSDGYYKPCLSWDDNLPENFVRQQIESLDCNVKCWTESGKEIDIRQMVL